MRNINKILMIFFFSFALFGDSYTFKELPIQEDGRIKPIDSYARNQLLRFYGKSSLKDDSKKNAIDWLKDIFSDSENSIKMPIFNIRNPEVAISLGLEKTDNHKYSFLNIINGLRENQDLLESLKGKSLEEQTLVEKQIIEVYQNVILFEIIKPPLSTYLHRAIQHHSPAN